MVARITDLATLDPSMDSSDAGLANARNLFDQLTSIEADGTVSPLMATSWSANDDATVWTFTPRTDAKFRNGMPVTAAGGAFSFQRVLDDKTSPMRSYSAEMVTVKATDDNKVVFTLNGPFERRVSPQTATHFRRAHRLGSRRRAGLSGRAA
jgi:peptide/nickel transport system substrate-binding protein